MLLYVTPFYVSHRGKFCVANMNWQIAIVCVQCTVAHSFEIIKAQSPFGHHFVPLRGGRGEGGRGGAILCEHFIHGHACYAHITRLWENEKEAAVYEYVLGEDFTQENTPPPFRVADPHHFIMGIRIKLFT